MIPHALRPLRDLMTDRREHLTFADLSEPILEDLALGWAEGRPLAAAAAQMLSMMDGIPTRGRDRQVAGRALLTLLVRQGAPVVVSVPSDSMRLLGIAALDQGDPEAELAWTTREQEYESLSDLDVEYPPEELRSDAAGAFAAARLAGGDYLDPGPDAVAAAHPLALLFRRLPGGLRAWFRSRHPQERADVLAWKFVLAGRALAKYRESLDTDEASQIHAVPVDLVKAVVEIPLGDLARTSILEPV